MNNDRWWFDNLLRELGLRWPWPSRRLFPNDADADAGAVPADGPPKVPRGPVRVRVRALGLGASNLRVARVYNMVDVHRVSDGVRLARIRIPSFADITAGAITASCDKGVLEILFPVHGIDPSPVSIPVTGPS